jgi:hypothetical protein
MLTSGLKIVLPQAPNYTTRAKFAKILANQGAPLVSMTFTDGKREKV